MFVNWGKKSWCFCFNSNDLYFEVQFRCESSWLKVDDLPHGVLFDILIFSTLIAYYLRSYFSRQSQFFHNFSFHEWIHCHRQQSFRMLNVLILTIDVFNHCLLVSMKREYNDTAPWRLRRWDQWIIRKWIRIYHTAHCVCK